MVMAHASLSGTCKTLATTFALSFSIVHSSKLILMSEPLEVFTIGSFVSLSKSTIVPVVPFT